MSRPRSLLAALFVVALACGTGCASAATPRGEGAAANRPAPARLAARIEREGARSTIAVTWAEVPAPAILLVQLDSPLAARHRAQRVRAEGAALNGLVLLRRVPGSGALRVAVDRRRLGAYLGDAVATVSVRVLPALTAEVLTGDPTVMGGQHVERVETIRPEDLPEQLRLVHAGDSATVAGVLPTAGPGGITRDERRIVAASHDLLSPVHLTLHLK